MNILDSLFAAFHRYRMENQGRIPSRILISQATWAELAQDQRIHQFLQMMNDGTYRYEGIPIEQRKEKGLDTFRLEK